MKKIIISILLLTFCVIIFLLLRGKDEQNLGGDYYYLPEYEAMDIGYPGGSIVYKAKEKYSFNDVKIKGNVLAAVSNDSHILASRRNRNSNEGNSKLQYFIIEKYTDVRHGPFSFDDFTKKAKELNVSDSLLRDFNFQLKQDSLPNE